jgi:hypothetical protein
MACHVHVSRIIVWITEYFEMTGIAAGQNLFSSYHVLRAKRPQNICQGISFCSVCYFLLYRDVLGNNALTAVKDSRHEKFLNRRDAKDAKSAQRNAASSAATLRPLRLCGSKCIHRSHPSLMRNVFHTTADAKQFPTTVVYPIRPHIWNGTNATTSDRMSQKFIYYVEQKYHRHWRISRRI